MKHNKNAKNEKPDTVDFNSQHTKIKWVVVEIAATIFIIIFFIILFRYFL